MRAGVLLHSALSGAVMAGITALLVVGAATIAAAALPLPVPLARLLERRGLVLALGTVGLALAVGAVLGYLEGRLKLR